MIPLVLRDCRLALRDMGGAGLGLAFFVTLVVVMPLGLGPDAARLISIAPGVMWVAVLFSCLLSMDRTLASDAEDGTLELLLISPLPPSSIIMARAAAHWLVCGLPLVVLAPALGLLLSLTSTTCLWLMVSLVAGTPGLSAIGTFAATLTLGIRRAGPLLSLIVMPMYVPTLILGAEVVRRGMEADTLMAPLLMLAAISVASLALLPLAGAAVLRAVLR